MKPTLVILAAGMGSRYGGMKQIDGVGSHGEPIIEFSIYDAKKAGFGKVVLIIKKEHEAAFRKALTDKIEPTMPVEFVYQDMNDIPQGFTVPEGRVKPWGTTHALLACRNTVHEPFALINADDFYGKDAQSRMQDDKISFTRAASLFFAAKPCKRMEYGIVIGKSMPQGIVDQLLTVTAMEVLVNGRIKSSHAHLSYL